MVLVVLGLMISLAVYWLSDCMKRFVWGFIKIFTNAKILMDGAFYLLCTLCYASLF
jgi:hypothetical protein